MLAEAFTHLSPQLAERYRVLLFHEIADSPELDHLHQLYTEYAFRDLHLPRPVLAYSGYHALADGVDFTDVDRIGDGLLLPQLLRDVLAIRDDIADEDLEKFGTRPLPVVLSNAGGAGAGAILTQHGKDLATYYADFLVGVMLRVVATLQPTIDAAAATQLLGDTLYSTQRGQLAELLAESRPLAHTSVQDLLLIGERKAAYYCYVFPFTLGARLAGHNDRVTRSVGELLARIGTASQVIDDLTGAFPRVIDEDKDTLGEIVNLRRTVPLVLLAQRTNAPDVRDLLAAEPPLPEVDACRLRDALWNSSVPAQAVQLCTRLIDEAIPVLDTLPLGKATTAYLRDLIQHRLIDTVERLRKTL